MPNRPYLATVPLVALAACGGATDMPVPAEVLAADSYFSSYDEAAGGLDHEMEEVTEFSLENDIGTGHFAVGINNGAYVATAGLSDVEVGGVLPNIPGLITYDAYWETAVIGENDTSDVSFEDFGDLQLHVSLDSQSVTSEGHILQIDGNFSGNTLFGTATYDGYDMPLLGAIGADGLIGAFHGSTVSEAYDHAYAFSGAIVGTPQED